MAVIPPPGDQDAALRARRLERPETAVKRLDENPARQPGRLMKRVARRLLWATPVWPLLRPRRFHAFCVGPAKTGTVSVKAMFAARYRAGHEAAFREVVELVVSRLEGKVSLRSVGRRLRLRDRRLRLEMDSFNQLGLLADILSQRFPRAKFILTVRQPASWLRSILNQHLNVDVSQRAPERRLRELLFHPGGVSYGRGDNFLQQRGLFPLDGYLRAWADHYARVLEAVPAERLLVVQTDQLAQSGPVLARFLGIPESSIDTAHSHMHRCPYDHGVFEALDPEYLREKVSEHCSAVAARLDRLAGVGVLPSHYRE